MEGYNGKDSKTFTPDALVDLGIQRLGFQNDDPNCIYTLIAIIFFSEFELFFCFVALFRWSAGQVQ